MTNIKLSSLNKGLVGHWTMSQDSLKGSLLADKTPYENDGTIYGATFTTDRMGQPNKCMYFDGIDDVITIEDSDELNFGNNDFSISLWTLSNGYISKGSKYNSIISKGAIVDDGHVKGYGISIYKDNKPLFQVNHADTYYAKGDYILNDGKWHHLVGIRDNNELKIYVDGILSSIQGSVNSTSFTNADLILGKSDYENRQYNGSIDDVRIYNRALSEPEIKTLYNSYNPNIKMKTSLPKIKLYGNE